MSRFVLVPIIVPTTCDFSFFRGILRTLWVRMYFCYVDTYMNLSSSDHLMAQRRETRKTSSEQVRRNTVTHIFRQLDLVLILFIFQEYEFPSPVSQDDGKYYGAPSFIGGFRFAESSAQQSSWQFSALQRPIQSPSPSATSPTDSSWEDASAPPSRGPSGPPSQPASRAPSMSAGVSGGKLAPLHPVFVPGSGERRVSMDSDAPFVIPGQKPGSVHSDNAEGGHKFNFKDLARPKLHRKSPQKSTSSKKSDSDAGDGLTSCTADNSVVGLTQKYGVCQKPALGKGVTSVIKLAHKWDRSEEKLYAIKVPRPFLSPSFPLPDAIFV